MGSSSPPGAPAFLETSPQNMFAPFSTSLPSETQQLVSLLTSSNAPSQFNPYHMSGTWAPFSYSYKPNSFSQPQSPAAGQHMVPTLSLNPLNTNVGSPDSQSYATSATTTDGINTPFSGALCNYDFNAHGMFAENMKNLTRTSSDRDSGVITPGGAADWTTFLESSEDGSSGHVSA